MHAGPLRNLPSVQELLENPSLRGLVERINRNTVVSTVRVVLDEVRQEIQTAAADRTLPNAADLVERIARRAMAGQTGELRPIINATGQLLESRFGWAPLAEEAVEAAAAAARDYASVETDLVANGSARRNAAVENLLRELTGAEAALAVNSHAAGVVLALAALAAGREVVVSRGQLIDVDEDCRLPDAAVAAGATLREIGATNKTELDDYARAVGEATAAMLLVRPGNFSLVGAAQSVALESLVGMGRQNRVPVIHDLVAAAMIDLRPFGLDGFPVLAESVQAGADLTIACGEKLVGGPQCGLLLGKKNVIERIDRHPLARALQIDKLTSAALIATLRLYRDPRQARLSIPLLQLLTASAENLKCRAERLTPQAAALAAFDDAEALPDAAPIGWGDDPARAMPTWCIALRPAAMSVARLAAALRQGVPSVVGRVKDDRLWLDLRSVLPRQDLALLAALDALSPQESSPPPPDRL